MQRLFKILGARALIVAIILGSLTLLHAQQKTDNGPGLDIQLGNPWFWIFIAFYFGSAIVSGMPEPTPASTNGYIWFYRTGHILVQQGTSYFQHKMFWPTSGNTTIVLNKDLQESK